MVNAAAIIHITGASTMPPARYAARSALLVWRLLSCVIKTMTQIATPVAAIIAKSDGKYFAVVHAVTAKPNMADPLIC